MTTLRSSSRPAVAQAFRTLYPLGLLGIAALLPSLPSMLRPLIALKPEGAPPLWVLVTLSSVQASVMLAAAVLAGGYAAPRLGLHSRLLQRDGRGLRRDLPVALPTGLLAGALVVGLDLLFKPYLGEAWLAAAAQQPRTLAITVSGLLYGGLTEELLLRWGVMSVLALALWKAAARRHPQAPAWVSVMALLLAALAFGAAHLAAVTLYAPLSAVLVARTVLLNALVGVACGWLFFRRSLEAGMLAHAASHVSLTLLALLA
ncbi:type II CAAX prenyl endopeptidase Rce1 family protein [Deinococcus sonorensis]|uniref:CPBP family glutamic-type intramembrane protease n=2 Tax=Deinococcus sonorensis TaxID=309891 RepID=A0AAU7U6X2_9DEIO